VLPQHDPVLVAKQVATLQYLSGGRLSLAVAVGYVEQKYEFLRAPFKRRGALLDEYLSAVRLLLEAEKPSFYGSSIEFDEVYFSPRTATRVLLFVVGGSPAAASAPGQRTALARELPYRLSRATGQELELAPSPSSCKATLASMS
jgi:alkanesulfonate monooxygenase SsuD/methylene tetrahydromethanopterin reductase-like flavin-dependent oxidoreductase (luciferase family)